MKRIEFYLGIGFANADHREIVEYPDDATEEEITEDLKVWAGNYIDMGYGEVEE